MLVFRRIMYSWVSGDKDIGSVVTGDEDIGYWVLVVFRETMGYVMQLGPWCSDDNGDICSVEKVMAVFEGTRGFQWSVERKQVFLRVMVVFCMSCAGLYICLQGINDSQGSVDDMRQGCWELLR